MPFIFERRVAEETKDRRGLNSSPSVPNKISNYTKESGSMQSLKLKRFAVKDGNAVEKRDYPQQENKSASVIGKRSVEEYSYPDISQNHDQEDKTPKVLDNLGVEKKQKSGTKKKNQTNRQLSPDKHTPVKKNRMKKKI